MKADINKLKIIGYDGSFTLWRYPAPELLSDALKLDFWNDLHDMVRVGDLIMVTGAAGAATLNISAVSLGHVHFQVMAATSYWRPLPP